MNKERLEILRGFREQAKQQWIAQHEQQIEAAKNAPSKQTIATFLRKARHDCQFSLQEVAELCGDKPSKSSLSMIELGQQSLDVEKYYFLCALYGVKPL